MSEQKIRSDEANSIGKNIQRLRLKNNIGPTELARKLQLNGIDITRETIGKIERGEQHIKLEQLRGIRDFFHTTYEELLDG